MYYVLSNPARNRRANRPSSGSKLSGLVQPWGPEHPIPREVGAGCNPGLHPPLVWINHWLCSIHLWATAAQCTTHAACKVGGIPAAARTWLFSKEPLGNHG